MQKLYLFCNNNPNSVTQMTFYYLLSKTDILKKYDIIYNPPYLKNFDIFSHSTLSAYLYSYYRSIESNSPPEIIQLNYDAALQKMFTLEQDAKSGKDILCCFSSSIYAILPIFFELIKEFPLLRRCEVHIIHSLTPAEESMHSLIHLAWKRIPFNSILNLATNTHFLHKADKVYDIFEKNCAKENIYTLLHNAHTPYSLNISVVQELFTILNIPLKTSQAELDALMPFPKSRTGLDLSYIFADFPFYLYEEQRLTKQIFYTNIQQTEKKESFTPLDFTLRHDAKKLAEQCAPAFERIARKLNKNILFTQQSTIIDFPEKPLQVPLLTRAECSLFIQNFPENWLKPMLCFFRDLPTLNPEQEVFAQVLEDHRAKKLSYPDFSYPRPKPLLTIVTTCFNHEKYIEDCIKSVIAQKCDFPIEHIIVDDASSDASVNIIAKYARQYSHIRPVYLQYRSGSLSAKSAFEICKSEYVALCDGDDFFTDPLKLQKQVDFLEKNPDYGLCFHPVSVYYEDGTNRDSIYPNPESLPRGINSFYYIADLLKYNFIQTNSVVYRWRFKAGIPLWFRADIVPSDWYWHLLHAEIGKIGFINEVMSTYRRHVASFYYGSEHVVEHRLKHGMDELNTYNAINEHFDGKYQLLMTNLSSGVFTSFLKHYLATKDDTYLNQASEAYPHFAKVFLNSIKNS